MHKLGDVDGCRSDVWIPRAQGIEQVADIVSWLDATFVDRVPVLDYVFDDRISSDPDVVDARLEAILVCETVLSKSVSD